MADRSDEATLASLAPAPPDQPQEPSKVKRRDNKSVEDPDEATLASLSAKAKLQGLRPRYDREPRLLHTCVLGFEEGAEDPMQSGEVNNTQSDEITEMQRNSKDPPPVTKTQRSLYVWVTKAKPLDNQDMYTMDPDQMVQVTGYEANEQNRCDICGGVATEEIYEFRCYRRRSIKEMLPVEDRALSPFISYIGKVCGRGLLRQSSALQFPRTCLEVPPGQFH